MKKLDSWKLAVIKIPYLGSYQRGRVLALINKALKTEAVCRCGHSITMHGIHGNCKICAGSCKKFRLDRSAS
jgi:hypothetical protein